MAPVAAEMKRRIFQPTNCSVGSNTLFIDEEVLAILLLIAGEATHPGELTQFISCCSSVSSMRNRVIRSASPSNWLWRLRDQFTSARNLILATHSIRQMIRQSG